MEVILGEGNTNNQNQNNGGGSNGGSSTQGTTSNNKGGQVQDTTTSPTNLPKTGEGLIKIGIIIISIVGLVVLVRYIILEKNTK